MPKDEVAVFDQTALKKRVTETIQSQFGMMIPEKEWTALVEKEIKAFFEQNGEALMLEEVTERTGFNQSRSTGAYKVKLGCPPFRVIVWNQLREICHKKVEVLLAGEKLKSVISKTWEGDYEHTEAELGSLMEKVLENIIPEMIQYMLRAVVGQSIEAIKMSVITHLNNQSSQF